MMAGFTLLKKATKNMEMNHEYDRTKCNTYSTAPTAKRTNTPCPDAAWVFELLAILVLIPSGDLT